ncbi:MAG TPA: S9 family peptidase [bacterium]|nr:S9 family peptidase [bacterium]
MKWKKYGIATLVVWGFFSILEGKEPFTVEDALNVRSVRIQDVTQDGRYAAITVASRKGRLNVNHERFGDPTYIAPNYMEVKILDTRTGEQRTLFREPVQARQFVWSNDGKRLGFFLLEGGQYRLAIYDRVKDRLRTVDLRSRREIASNSGLAWLPDGKQVLLSLRERGWADSSRALFLRATQGPVVVYDSREPFLKWEVIRDRSSLSRLVRTDTESGRVETVLPEGRYTDLRLTRDGLKLSWVQYYPVKTDYSREGGTDYELKVMTLKDTAVHVLHERSGKRIQRLWNEDNTVMAWSDRGHIFIQALDDTAARSLTRSMETRNGDTLKVQFSIVRWSPDGSRLLAREKNGFWIIQVDEEKTRKILALDLNEQEDQNPRIEVQAWSRDNRNLYFHVSARDRWERGLARFDIQDSVWTDLVRDRDLYSQWHALNYGRRFIYEFSDGDLPGDLFAADSTFEDPLRLTVLNPWMHDKKLTRSELIRYLDVDGNRLYGILYYPVDYDSSRIYPLVCEIYETFFNNGFNESMNLIANAGFFGFRPSVKLAIGYPGEAWIKGVTCGINALIERGLVDPEKLGVHGTSYGGYATSLLITQTDRFAAAINISGKTNIISFLGDSPRIGTRNYAAAEVGQDRIGVTLWEAPLKYMMHSAVMFADRVKTPHLLLTGDDDWNVPAASTREMYYALRRLGKECVWVNYMNGGHGAGRASDEAEYHDQWKRILDWYRDHFEEKKKEKKIDE